MPDLMRYKYQKLRALQGKGDGNGFRGKIGIPFGLNMYENLPFWFAFFTKLNFEVVLSPESTRKLYIKGQRTIPSDTVCYPAKLLHGHVMALLDEGVDTIFYPCMSYNFDEGTWRQPLQLPRRRLLPRPAGGEHPRPVQSQVPPPQPGHPSPERL